MRAMSSDSRISVGLGAALAGAATFAAAQVPQPPINGVVMQDVTQTFIFDRVGTVNESAPFVDEGAYRGAVRSMVIRAPDNTYDFYFHFTTSEDGNLLRRRRRQSHSRVLWRAEPDIHDVRASHSGAGNICAHAGRARPARA